MLRLTGSIALIISGCLLASTVNAQRPPVKEERAYPVKPIRILVPFVAGGPTDAQARWAAQQIGAALGQQTVVDNRTGAGGILAAEVVAKSEPDGYTLLVGNAGPLSIAPSIRAKLPYDVLRDLTPITLIAKTASCMCVHPGVPAANMQEFIAFAKTRPGKINYGSSGIGTVGHLAIELLSTRSGIKLNHVPYKGAAQIMIDQIAGNIELTSVQFASTAPFVKVGKLRALGVTSVNRSSLMPEIPTVAEQGLPGFEAGNWAGMLAPKGTSPKIIARIHDILKNRMTTPEAHRLFTEQGHELTGLGPEEFGVLLRSEIETWGKVAKAAGIPKE